MEAKDLDILKTLKHDRVITDEEYSSKILNFAEEYLTRDTKLDILGIVEKGSYGGVLVAKEPGAWEEMSVKVVASEKCNKLEVEHWQNLRHPHISRLLYKQYIPQIDAYAFMTELHVYTLETYLAEKWFSKHKNAPLIVKKILKEILEGLNYLHKRNYSHLNLTAENVRISKDYKAVLTNFASLSWIEVISNEQEVLQHKPPETCKHFTKNSNLVLQGDLYDIWSYGILVLNMFTKNYVRRKAPKKIASWCESLYPVIFKILQENTFKEYAKKAFSSCKIDKQTRSIMLNYAVTCLRIFLEERPSADLLFHHKYFKTDGFLSFCEDAWDRKVKMKPTWISKHSTARIIQQKKQELVKSLSKRDVCKETEICHSESKVQIGNSTKQRGKPVLMQEDGCKVKVPADVGPSQSVIKESTSNTNTIEPILKYLEPNVFRELNEILQKDIIEKSTIRETDVVEPISKYLEPKVFRELNEILQKESGLLENSGAYTPVDPDFEEKLKPVMLKVPTDAISIDNFKFEKMPNCKQFKHCVKHSHSKLSKDFGTNENTNALLVHQEQPRYQAEDFTKLERAIWKNKSFPCMVDAAVKLSPSEVQMHIPYTEEANFYKTSNSKNRTDLSETCSRLTDVTDRLARPVQSMGLLKTSGFELFTGNRQKGRNACLKDIKRNKDLVVSQATNICPDKVTILKTSEIFQEKPSVVTCFREFGEKDGMDDSISDPHPLFRSTPV